MLEVEHVLSVNNVLGESPIWNMAGQVLFWVDIHKGQVFKFTPNTRNLEIQVFDQQISCLAQHVNSGLILAASEGILYWGNNQKMICASREQLGVKGRFNDGAVDRAGRFWIGTASDDPENNLYRLDSDGAPHVMESGLIISNGIGWSPDNKTMYLSDSGGSGVVYAYDFDLDSGSISNRRIFLPPTGTGAVADGLTVDSEGCLWIAFWDGWRVERRAPDGRLLQKIDMPVQRPTSCAFGGDSLTDLYVTSASIDISRKEQPQAGDLFRIRTEVRGLPEPLCDLIVEPGKNHR